VFDSHSLPPTKICVSALTDAAVYVTLARIHDGNGQYNLALQEIRQALKLEPHTGGQLFFPSPFFTCYSFKDRFE